VPEKSEQADLVGELRPEVVTYQRSYPRDFIEEISPDDRMHRSKIDYFDAGLSALRSIRLAMLESGREGFEEILDFGCGFGRVLRMLKASFPDARLTAADVRPDGVDFCARAFGATPVYSGHDPADLDLGGPFDLIWCGSVFTHFSAAHWGAFLPFFGSLLAPEGLLVFTTQGRVVIREFQEQGALFGLSAEETDQLLASYEESGFGFVPYENLRPQGVTVSSPSWVLAQIERLETLRLVSFNEGVWAGQDVVACAHSPLRPSLPTG
jgi:SAM-dependent methyltransferase